ncbi:hypothetical protein [Planctomyces sp. SH-PL62]|uniref:hypothetical protein n=1 Tax=Planctomyces sp. SH-PL62 TaxID=1636152 RepID=UPI00078E6568|nr:hypothetical protein [Planctomyces sp. SH-PL62]AMV36204.1 hypothetical protein VT85_02090 [Planctomyces sp. SH-PL62]
MNALLPLLLLVGPLLGQAPIDVGDRKQLFIDDRFIAERDRVELRANPPRKLGLIRDEAGEPFQGHVARVIEDGGKIRLYLGAEDVRVLESDDGVHFRRTDGKLPGGGTFPTIFLDPHERDPARRYKLFRLVFSPPFDPATHGVYASYSADGVNFTEVGRVLPFFTDNPPVVHWDERIGKYVIYTRALSYVSENQRRIGRIETDDPLKPWPYRKTDDDRMFFSTENVPVVLAADEEDDPHSDMYYNASAIYPWAQDVYLMFPALFRHFSPERNPYVRPRVPGQWEDYGMLEVQLAVSRDGVNWSRPGRSPYIATGLADEWDRWYAVAGPGMARRGNYLYQYYYSSGRLHDSAILRAEYDDSAKQLGGVGVVQQRLDGFVSADVDHKGGWLRTPALVFRGDRLRLNLDTGAMGTAFVEIQDAEGRPIPGFALADCEEIGGDFVDQRVYWKGSPDVSTLAGRPVRIHFQLRRAKLYAFQFTRE